MRSVSPHSLEGDAGWHMRDLYAEVTADLDKYQVCHLFLIDTRIHSLITNVVLFFVDYGIH